MWCTDKIPIKADLSFTALKYLGHFTFYQAFKMLTMDILNDIAPLTRGQLGAKNIASFILASQSPSVRSKLLKKFIRGISDWKSLDMVINRLVIIKSSENERTKHKVWVHDYVEVPGFTSADGIIAEDNLHALDQVLSFV